MMDSKGNLFMTTRTYYWNKDKSRAEVDAMLQSYFGATKIHALLYTNAPGTPADYTGHIDMFAKLLNDETVLLAQPEFYPFLDTYERAVQYFKKIKTPTGKDYKILSVPGWKSNDGDWYTYTNSLIVTLFLLIKAEKPWKLLSRRPMKRECQGL